MRGERGRGLIGRHQDRTRQAPGLVRGGGATLVWQDDVRLGGDVPR
jgi:hypothetical protein